MKIAMLHAVLPSVKRGKEGGVTYFVHDLANEMVKRGHDLTMFSLDERPQDALYEVRTIRIPERFRNNRLARYYLTPFLFSRQKLGEFEAIHTHGDDWLMSRKKMPRVRTMFGSALAEARHSLNWKRRLNHLVLYQLERLSVWQATRSVAISHDTIRYYPKIRQVIGCGVDTRSFRPAPGTTKSEKPSVLFVGTLGGRKRGEFLVEQFRAQVQTQIPEAELWLVAEKAVEGAGLVNLGKVSKERLIELYQQAWVFCLPSTYEGFGIPYVEALAAGTPVVATSNPGSREVLEDGKYGLISEDAALGRNLAELLEDADRRVSMTAAGLKRAQDYDWETITEAYVKIYGEIATWSKSKLKKTR